MHYRSLTIALLLAAYLVPSISVHGQDLPPEAFISGLVSYAQSYNLSCESRSATDWAAFWGTSTSENEILSILPRSDNPEIGFVGDPNGSWGYIPPNSYGVHAQPIANALQSLGVAAKARRGMTWDEAQREIAEGRPVIVWVVGQMWGGSPIFYTTADGVMVRVARYEHTMILVGYTVEWVHVMDSYTGLLQVYDLESFLASWQVLENQAVVYDGQTGPTATSTNFLGETYTVQRGDYLSALAGKLEVDWRDLAAANFLSYPYIIHPGQILQLPGKTAETPETRRQISQPTATPSPPPSPTLSPTPTPSATSTPIISLNTETYTVQRGDYLFALAREFNLDWMFLADLNGIGYPYLIHPGQVLRLR